MASRKLQVRMTDLDLEALKKRAVFAGKNISDFARDLIHAGLDSGSGPKQTIDPESVRKAVEVAIHSAGLDEVKAEIRSLERILSDTRAAGAGATAGYPWTEDQVRHLVYTLARLDKFFTVYNAAWGQNDANVGTRARVASEAGDRAVQKFGLKEDDHAR